MNGEGDRRRVSVGPRLAGERTDSVLAELLDHSRTRIQKLLQAGDIEVEDGSGHRRVPRKSEPAEEGWVFHVRVPPPEETGLEPQDLPLTVVWEDADLAVIDKAAGMVVHPAPGHPDGTLVNALLFHLRDLSGVGGRLRPGIVHRLDRDTSGLLVVAKTDRAHVALADALRRRRVKRLYRALVWGTMPEPEGTIDAPVGRDPRNRKRMAVVEGGRRAVTRYRVREDWPAAQLLDVALKTGRTHQIRVHTAHLGHPVVGDPLYGAGGARGISGAARRWATELERRVRRQFLHAAELAFDHPVSGERMHFQAALPPELSVVVEWARGASG
ncbi:MAG TPA: RluA family pseudouridine synthase [Longimicrobiales bacterium]|nr:RluA family pseudouridine synthase [Longimicrobiales bacterium]